MSVSSETYDVVIVGAGVIGLSVARELLRRELSVLVLEKEEDVGRGASGRNSGVIHPGFSVAPGTLKARLNVEGSRAMRDACRELSVPFQEVGTLVVAREAGETPVLEDMKAAGEGNGLTRLDIVGEEEIERLEPSVHGAAALWSPEGAIIDPFTLVLRLADNCLANGCEIAPSATVEALARGGSVWTISTSTGTARAPVVVNAAGVSAPLISAMAGAEVFDSFPCRGEYFVLDKRAAGLPRRMVYPTPPTSGGLGVHFTPTADVNMLIGPSAEYVMEGENYATTPRVMSQLVEEARALCPGFDPADIITSFAGVRAKISKGAYGESEFVIEESRKAPGLVNLIGIDSPGLSSSPAIGEMAAGMGRCQGGFCTPRIVQALRERGVAVGDITLKGRGSEMFTEETKGPLP